MRMKAPYLLAAGTLLSMGNLTLSQGVGPGGPFDTMHTLRAVGSTPENRIDWVGVVGSGQSPVSLELDPSGPVWVRRFEVDGGSPITAGMVVGIRDYLVIDGQRQWLGWRDGLEDPRFDWVLQSGFGPVTRIRANGVPVSDLVVTFRPASPTEGGQLDLTFPELVPGTALEIWRQAVYRGSEAFYGSVNERVAPTPEPATALFAFSGLALAGRRR